MNSRMIDEIICESRSSGETGEEQAVNSNFRKWAPRFDYLLTQSAYPAIDHGSSQLDANLIKAFEEHPIRDVLRITAQMRLSVDTFIQ